MFLPWVCLGLSGESGLTPWESEVPTASWLLRGRLTPGPHVGGVGPLPGSRPGVCDTGERREISWVDREHRPLHPGLVGCDPHQVSGEARPEAWQHLCLATVPKVWEHGVGRGTCLDVPCLLEGWPSPTEGLLGQPASLSFANGTRS